MLYQQYLVLSLILCFLDVFLHVFFPAESQLGLIKSFCSSLLYPHNNNPMRQISSRECDGPKVSFQSKDLTLAALGTSGTLQPQCFKPEPFFTVSSCYSHQINVLVWVHFNSSITINVRNRLYLWKNSNRIPWWQCFLLNWKTLWTTFSTSLKGCCIFGCTNGVKWMIVTSTCEQKQVWLNISQLIQWELGLKEQ